MSSRGQDLHVPEEIAKLLVNHALGPLWVSNASGSRFLHWIMYASRIYGSSQALLSETFT
jgi:hypothetical protein